MEYFVLGIGAGAILLIGRTTTCALRAGTGPSAYVERRHAWTPCTIPWKVLRKASRRSGMERDGGDFRRAIEAHVQVDCSDAASRINLGTSDPI